MALESFEINLENKHRFNRNQYKTKTKVSHSLQQIPYLVKIYRKIHAFMFCGNCSVYLMSR